MLAKVLNLNLLTINKQIGRVESIAFEIPRYAYTLTLCTIKKKKTC